MFELRKAIETDQLLLYFQPKIDLRTMRVDGVERRSDGPTLGEDSSLPTRLSQWVNNQD